MSEGSVREPGVSRAFTLIVPTFNRPAVLAQLLTYLGRHKAEFPVLILDSSDDEAKAANAAFINGGRLDLDVRLLPFASSITPFEKFWRGSEEVRTDFCGFCADDDVVMLDAIPTLVEFLRTHSDVSAAHGLYFTFYATDHIGITSIVYAGPSFDADASVARFRDLFRRYEAVTYAVYRTGVMRDALKAVLPLQSMLARELLGSGLTVIAGKVVRLPLLYYGRSLHPSWPYQHWHPVDFLISSPQELFEDYARCRPVLQESLTKNSSGPGTPADMLQMIDLTLLRYLADYVGPAVMDYVIEQVLAGTPKDEIMTGVWPRLAASSPAPKPEEPPPSRSIQATTFGGRPREYRLYGAFSSVLTRTDRRRADTLISGMLREMNAYE